MFHTWHAGADCVNPAAYNALRANGDKAWFGWPDVPDGREGGRQPGSTPRTSAEEKAAMGRLNKAAMEDVVYVADRLLPRLPGLAEERHAASSSGPLPVLLGCDEGLMPSELSPP